ncbi:MAG: aminodeoxychorismate/anthranilate synthase component II [Candidatus Paceibacterota bacterium]
MILLIDNYDSFTYNLYQLISSLGYEVLVKTHDEVSIKDIQSIKPEKIVISPGPKRPEDAGISMELIKKLYREIPILGVCLGHQCIGKVFGGEVVHAKQVFHGKTSVIHHDGKGIFQNVKNPINVARYHSLALKECPREFEVRATTEDMEIMAIQHKEYPLYGIQFHPESFMTECGEVLIKNFLEISYEVKNS